MGVKREKKKRKETKGRREARIAKRKQGGDTSGHEVSLVTAATKNIRARP